MDNFESSTNRLNENEINSSTDESSSSKKRKLDTDLQEEIDLMKHEIEEQKETICDQAKTIRELHKQRNSLAKTAGTNKNIELERSRNVEAELRSKIIQLETQAEAEKKKAEAEMAGIKFVMNDQMSTLQKENEAKDVKINDLEAKLSSLKEVKHESDYASEMRQENNAEIQLLPAETYVLKETIKERDRRIKNIESIIESKENDVVQLQAELVKMEKYYKDELQKNKELQDKHNKEMTAVITELQGKIDNGKKRYEAEITALTSTNKGLSNMMSEKMNVVATHYQDQIQELHQMIIVAENTQKELQSKIEVLEQNELVNRAVMITNESQIQDLQNELEQVRTEPVRNFVELDEVCDGPIICYDRLVQHADITVIKVDKLSYDYPKGLTVYSNVINKEMEFNLPEYLKNIFRLQVNGELKLHTSYYERIMPRIHSCNLIKLDTSNVDIRYEDFMKFVSSHTITTFSGGSIKRNGEMLGMDEIMKELPNIEDFEIKCCNISNTSFYKLVQLPIFSNLRQFKLTTSSFDPGLFTDFIKKHQTVEFKFGVWKMQVKGQSLLREKLQKLLKSLPSECNVSILR